MHIDYWHDDQGVDVKGNNLPDEIWVELKNVQGKHGWLFGEATSIAFDMPELASFVVVDREELKDYCKEQSRSQKEIMRLIKHKEEQLIHKMY